MTRRVLADSDESMLIFINLMSMSIFLHFIILMLLFYIGYFVVDFDVNVRKSKFSIRFNADWLTLNQIEFFDHRLITR